MMLFIVYIIKNDGKLLFNSISYILRYMNNNNEFTFSCVQAGNIAGRFPSRKQIKFPVCSWIIREIILRRQEFLPALMNGDFFEIEKHIHETANGKFWETHKNNITINPRSQFDEARIDIFKESDDNMKRDNIFWGFQRVFYPGCVPITLGGLPELHRKEILENIEKTFQIGNIVAITRCSHSFMFIVISTGLFLLYDPAQSNIYLLNKNGILQHIFMHEFVYSEREEEFEYFNTHDFFMAYQNFKSDDWDFSHLIDKIFGKEELKESDLDFIYI